LFDSKNWFCPLLQKLGRKPFFETKLLIDFMFFEGQKKYGPIAPTQCQNDYGRRIPRYLTLYSAALSHPLQRTRKRRSVALGVPPILRRLPLARRCRAVGQGGTTQVRTRECLP